MKEQNKDLTALINTLEKRDSLKRDFVSNGQYLALCYDGEFSLLIPGKEEVFFEMSPLFEVQLAEKLNIPLPYYKKLKETSTEILRDNVNGWLELYMNKKYLIRSYIGEETTVHTARAFLSGNYNIIDDLKVLETVQKSLEKSSAGVYVQNFHLTENRLYLNVMSSQYVTDGIASGFTISNSETGQGALEIRPRAVILDGGRSLVTKDVTFRKIHLGGKMKSGEVEHDDEKYKAVESAIDKAIGVFINKTYLDVSAGAYKELSNIKLKYPIDALQNVFKSFGIPESFRMEILARYMGKPNQTAQDLFNAVSDITSQMGADLQYEIEGGLLQFLFKTKNYDKPY